MKKIYTLYILIHLTFFVSGQMLIDGQTKTGHEWIDYTKEYYKFKIHVDGIYRIKASVLQTYGINLDQVNGEDFQLYSLGKEVPIHVSTTGRLNQDDFIEFFGQRNRGELDSYHFPSRDVMLNPDYSMISDTNAYFLTWKKGTSHLRYSIEQNNLTGQLPAPEKYYIHSHLESYTERFYKPTEQGQDFIRYSNMVACEGYSLPITNSRSATIPIDKISASGDSAIFRIRFGINKVDHNIHLTFNGKKLNEYLLSHQYFVFNDEYKIPLSDLRTNNALLLEGTLGPSDRVLLSQVEIKYPRDFDFNNRAFFRFTISGSPNRKYLEINQFKTGPSNFLLDLNNRTRSPVNVQGNKVLVGTLPGNTDKDYILFNNVEGEGFQSISLLQRVLLSDLSKADSEYVIVTSNKLFSDPENSGINWIEEYAQYRSSPEGGGFKTIIVSAEDLYNHFGYGIDRHFYSINNFAVFAEKHWPSLKYFFVIGKGIEYQEYRSKSQQENPQTAPFYVPAWGNPGSDNLLFAERGNNYPLKPTGRISVASPAEVGIYLNKIKTQEQNQSLPQTIQDKYWTKRMIHLSGGGLPAEQTIIRSFLRRMNDIIAGEQFGADITTFEKTSSDPLQTATSDRILRLIDGGVSLITFFGHSAVGTFDFSLEDPSKYKNSGRLPMIISLGCYSGNIFVPGKVKGLSESFVLEPEVGAVAFAAASGTAYISTQGQMGITIYEGLTGPWYGQSIGEVLHKTLITLSDRTAIGFVTLLQQYVLHGDPAYTFVTHKGPDYVIDFETLKTEPSIISTSDRTFTIGFDIVNLGSALLDSMVIMLEHIAPDGSIVDTLYSTIQAPAFRQKIEFELENSGTLLIGRNSVRAVVNFTQSIQEVPADIAFGNNAIDDGRGGNQFYFTIVDNAANPVYPFHAALVTENNPVLKASTSNVFTSIQQYIFEIDTSAFFENPLERGVVLSGGGLIQWAPTLMLSPGIVYYWRVTPEMENPVLGRLWATSHFTYSPQNYEGWSQSHYYQFLENEFDGLVLPENRIIQFDTSGFFINIRNKLFNADVPPALVFNFEGSAASVRPWSFMSQGMAVFVVDPISGAGWTNSGGEYGSINTNSFGSFRCFGYDTNIPKQREDLIHFLENIIPEGSYVFIFSVIRTLNSNLGSGNWRQDQSSLGTDLFDVLKKQGSLMVENLEENQNVPYVFIYEKGKKAMDEVIAESIFDEANGAVFVPILREEGKMKSAIIGPSLQWNSFSIDLEDVKESEKVRIAVIGVSANKDETQLLEVDPSQNISLESVSPDLYPYLRLEFFAANETEKTIPSIKSWSVDYISAPDFVFNQQEKLEFKSDSIQRGDLLSFSSVIQILSPAFLPDSIDVVFTLTDSQNQSNITYHKYKLEKEGVSSPIDFEKSTSELLGRYQFSVELNPENRIIEKFAFNNHGIKEFYVISDDKNPILDVTFDGLRIMDGDIVSPAPEIIITLTDENPFFLLDDPELFEMKLDTGNINALVTIFMNSPEIEFIPATHDKNEARILYTPDLKDGIYTLFVQGKDKSNNFSGINDYRVSFRVIESNSVSQMFNYPNPFSTATQFVFTLTGSVPEHMKIQIMTITGKVVREITREELGPLQIGVNRTQYWWDGTDEYGDRLANGVYLYRVIMKDETGENYEKFSVGRSPSEIDKFFKKGFGKMVIIR